MAEFECKVYKLTIEEHPNADKLELAVVGDYRSIVAKGEFKTGDLGVYIPEAAVCPEWLIERLGLTGKLAGKQHNRVKAVKLRGVLSQGLIYPLADQDKRILTFIGTEYDKPCWTYVEEGQDVTTHLGITKYEPPIPVHMQGEVFNAHGRTLSYDIENYKKYPDVLVDGEDVIMTEKIHGTWCCFGYHPSVTESHIITSKGMSGQGLAFKVNAANENNLYLRALQATANASGATVLDRAAGFWGLGNAFYILGEVYGAGVQKGFGYGLSKPGFRVFDIYWGHPGEGRYADAEALEALCLALEVEKVPEVYRGPFSKEVMLEHTQGKECLSGNEANMREGVVIRPFKERHDLGLGRVILKSISEEYLLRKGGTEYN